MYRTLLFLIIIQCLCAFNSEYGQDSNIPRKYFAAHKIGKSSDYGILKFNNPDDHVATIHDFLDDSKSCQEIVEALNSNACKEIPVQCLNPYTCIALNK